MPNQVSGLVPPGSETGLYYIPVSNLARGTTWRQLKDRLRSHCEVDHVEVYPNESGAHVRVIGYENFVAAYNRLNGAFLNGRNLNVSIGNRDFPAPMRHLAANEVMRPPPNSGQSQQGYMSGVGGSGGSSFASTSVDYSGQPFYGQNDQMGATYDQMAGYYGSQQPSYDQTTAGYDPNASYPAQSGLDPTAAAYDPNAGYYGAGQDGGAPLVVFGSNGPPRSGGGKSKPIIANGSNIRRKK